MAQHHPERVGFFLPPDSRTLTNQPTSTADSAAEDMAGEADEPPDPLPNKAINSKSSSSADFKKSVCNLRKNNSLLTRGLHSGSDSQVDDDDSPFFQVSRAQSSASTHSRGSVVSMCELTSDGHTSPTRTNSPSPPLPPLRFAELPPIFNQETFKVPSTIQIAQQEQVAPNQRPTSGQPNEQKVEAGLGRKRCITFACGGRNSPAAAERTKAQSVSEAPVEKPQQAQPRKCSLKFICPTRANVPASKPHVRLSSPPPPGRRLNPAPRSPATTRSHRGSDSTVRNDSPKTVRKVPSAIRARRESGNSDVSRSEATRFHEFASSEEEVADWTQEKTCYRSRLTVDDTLTIEHKLRKIAQEVEEEEEEEEEAEDEADEDAIEDEDDDEDEDEEEDVFRRSVSEREESDDGFQTDDELGFGPSDDESDGDSDYDWWAPGRANVRDQVEHIRPTVRRNSESSIASRASHEGRKIRRKKSNPMDVNHPPELPDSTDFVCGTLDEDKPLEQAWITHLAKRRNANRSKLPQDIDPTFPESDPELDEEDEVSETYQHSDSDHANFLHGDMEMHDEGERKPRGMVPRKRSPLNSPKRLRSPPPTKRIHRSPAAPRRLRSPAPMPPLDRRISSSVPRNQEYKIRAIRAPLDEAISDDDTENTPRFRPRRAIDIVKGLEKKRQRRREKLAEKYGRKAAKSKDKKQVFVPGKGCERMREMGIELNAYRGKKMTATQQNGDEVHMLSY